MEIIGYSERGMINSLLYELKYSPQGLNLLNKLLSIIFFSDPSIYFQVTDAKILIEQSFSDFGDADVVLFLDTKGCKQSVFIEAKVKTFQKATWSIEKEFKCFNEGIQQNKVSSSNLFTQLYHKVRLVKALQSGGIDLLQSGVTFPKCSSKELRKIGNNKIVLNAVNNLMEYDNDVFFIALVPDNISNVRSIYKAILNNYMPPGFQEWSFEKWGFLTWVQVEDFCKEYDLKGTQEVFNFNTGQIY